MQNAKRKNYYKQNKNAKSLGLLPNLYVQNKINLNIQIDSKN